MEPQSRPDFEADVDLPSFVKVPDEDVTPVAAPAASPNVDAFDPAISDYVDGLMYLGYLEHKCTVLGHTFVLHSLKSGAELLVGQITAEYQGTHLHGRAYATGLVAAAIELVDGHPLLAPFGPDEEPSIRQRFDYINKRWHWHTINAVYAEFMKLQDRVAKAYEALLEK